MYAIIQDGGHQYRVEEGQTCRVQKKDVEVGSTLTFEQVAAVGGDGMKIGTPYVDGASVSATVLRQGKAKKIIVSKFRRRKYYRRRQGHRQRFTEIRVDSINA